MKKNPKWNDFEEVYEPSEDSFLFMDALLESRSQILALHPMLVLEIGSGSGVVGAFLGRMLGPSCSACLSLAVDVNPRAAVATRTNHRLNGLRCDVLLGDLVSWCAAGALDAVLFNPPYVPTPAEEVGGVGLEASWAGGERGRQVIDRLLPDVARVLRPGGLFFLLLVEENEPAEVVELLGRHGFVEATLDGVTVLRRRSANEKLRVICSRKK